MGVSGNLSVWLRFYSHKTKCYLFSNFPVYPEKGKLIMQKKKFMMMGLGALTLLGSGIKSPEAVNLNAMASRVKMASGVDDYTSSIFYNDSTCTEVVADNIALQASDCYTEINGTAGSGTYNFINLGSVLSRASISAYQGTYMNIIFSTFDSGGNEMGYEDSYELYIYDGTQSSMDIAYADSMTLSQSSVSSDIADLLTSFEFSSDYSYTAIAMPVDPLGRALEAGYSIWLKATDTFMLVGQDTDILLNFTAFDRKSGVIEDGQTADIAVNVDDAPTIDEILAQVTAEDLLGASVTVKCSDTEKAKYNPNLLGTYTLTITATDGYGQTATAYLRIKVVDVTAPTVVLASGKNLNFHVGDTLVYSNIGDYFTITDNASSKGGTINAPTYKLQGLDFTADYTFQSVGTYTLAVSVTDSSYNVASKNFTITVTDNEAPVVSRRDGGSGSITVGLSRVFSLTKSDFLALFQATDAVDGDVSSTLAIDGDFIPSKVGLYFIIIKANDTSANYGYLTVSVVVDVDMPPVFVLSDSLINATTSNPLTSAQIQKVIALAFYADENVSTSNILINDTVYQANSTKAGTYTVSYSVTYTSSDGEQHTDNKNLTITVTDTGSSATEEEELSGWKKFWQCLKNWFRGVFTKFKFNCFITDAEWDARFAE